MLFAKVIFHVFKKTTLELTNYQVLISLALTMQPVVSINVDLSQFTGGACEDNTFISPTLVISSGQCSTWSTSIGRSLSVSTVAGDFTCPDGQNVVLHLWQSSNDCSNLADATIGPLATEPTVGGCITMPVRSAQLACQGA